MLHRKSELTREEGMQSIVSMHESITSPLSQLGNRLSRCFVHAVWSLTWRFSTKQSNMQEVERDLVQSRGAWRDESWGMMAMIVGRWGGERAREESMAPEV